MAAIPRRCEMIVHLPAGRQHNILKPAVIRSANYEMSRGLQQAKGILDQPPQVIQMLHYFSAHYNVRTFRLKRMGREVLLHIPKRELNLWECFPRDLNSRFESVKPYNLKPN